MEIETQTRRVLRYARQHGMIRPRDLRQIGVPRVVLYRLADRGELIQRSRGVYTVPDHEPTPQTDIAEVCARAPKATVCLVSALQFHGLTTQVPHAVWIMIDRRGWRPKITRPRLRIIYGSGRALTDGVETHEIEGVSVRLTSVAKTVADCFKYRDHVGQDVAIEALQDCLRHHRATPSQIYEMAKIDRVAKRVRPYMEALT
jgi:predicted transcriptional regulator of viral defense system